MSRRLVGLTLALAALMVHAQPVRPIVAVEVGGVALIAGSEKGAKQRIRELSGLEWDRQTRRLVAVSDRGWLYTLQVEQGSPKATVLARREIAAARVDAESVCADGHGVLHVADEKSGRLLRLDSSGTGPAEVLNFPEPLSDPKTRAKPNSGVEAIACHQRLGIIAAPQRSLDGDHSLHRLYANAGRSWAFRADRSGVSTIKAFHLLDGDRLLVLEKVFVDPVHRTLLREIDLNGCDADAPCDPRVLAVAGTGLSDIDNFEGLACRDDRHCWVVSDGDANDGTRTVLVVLTLRRE